MIAPVMPTYARAPLEFERGEGSWLISTDGEKYLDFGAGIAVNCLGHAHPKLIEALEGQARRMWHTSNLYQIPGQTRMAERLVEHTFGDTVFFTNSGAEAMELCIKMARKYWAAKGEDRWKIITFEGCFHGRTIATISSAAYNDKLVNGFGPLLEGFEILPFGDHDALRAAAAKPDVAAIMLEPVQGESGIRPIPHVCQRGVRELCDEHGLLMILDEVQVGAGRSGALFAHENAGYTPDIMGVAKGIGGGFPMGCCIATENAAQGMTAGTHGSTYGGNPLAMAVGNAVLDELTAPGFLEDVKRKAGYLRQRLAELADTHDDLIEEVRGEGLMLGIRWKDATPVGDAVNAAYDQKMLTVPAGNNVMRILPPLNCSEQELGEAVNRLDAACRQLKAA